MTDTPRDEAKLPLIDERLSIEKRTVETGRVRISTVVDEREEWINEILTREEVEVTRVPIDRVVEAMPQPRSVADALVIPVIEEILVVEKRYLLKEEIHVRTLRHREAVHEPVTLKSTHARIERQ